MKTPKKKKKKEKKKKKTKEKEETGCLRVKRVCVDGVRRVNTHA